MALIRIPSPTNIPFSKYRWIFLFFSGVVVTAPFIFYGLYGLNYGVDFKGGLSLEIRTPAALDLGSLRAKLSHTLETDVLIQQFGSPQDLLIRVDQKDASEGGAQVLVEKIRQTLPSDVEYRKIETIGPKVGSELVRNGVIAVLWSLVFMFAYIWFRFEWRFGIAAFASLLQDCVWVFGLFSICRMEFNETAIVALLITASYSINDTVVIFDRIRENRGKYRKMPTLQLIDLSINETLSRTILTSLTTLLALGVLYFLGGPVIASYSFPILVGIVMGTYSSICFAPTLLLVLDRQQGPAVNTNVPSRP